MKGDHERGVVVSEKLAALRDLFESEVKRLDQLLAEREKEAQKGLAEALRARELANEWRATLNDREKSYTRVEAHDLLAKQVDTIAARQIEGRGRQTAWVAAAGIIATLIAIGVGQIIRQGITASDVSAQIQREAPWNRDKAAVTRRIALLEAQVQRNEIDIAKLQSDLRAHQALDATLRR